MNISIIGASGFIGSHLALYFSDKATIYGTYFMNEAIKMPGCSYIQVDALQPDSLLRYFEIARPDVVILSAGTRDLAFCENEPDRARQAHYIGTKNILDACKKHDPYIIYISTDCVFDGSRSIFFEDDAVNPINQYGKIKLETERLIQAYSSSALILRVSLTYGWALRNQNSNTVYDVIRTLTKEKTITLPTTLYNTPIYVYEIGRFISDFILTPKSGIFHLAGTNRVSRYELGICIALTFGLNPTFVLPTTVHQGIRPTNSCLGVEKIEKALNRTVGNLEEGLSEMSSDYLRLCDLPFFHDKTSIL